jgi:hypothetical protein|tara:strand:- start:727 stop:936 length:210 start_codon:yes stop_codon:yes gene_type:complete
MTKLYLEGTEKLTVEFSLIEFRVNAQERIEHYTNKLNGSSSTEDVNHYTDLIRIQKDKLNSINNILNKL